MNIRLNTSPVCLARNQAVTLTDAKGSQVRCLRGGLWITQDRDQRDIVLAPGESFTIDRGGPAIVWALADSSVDMRPVERPRALASIARRSASHLYRTERKSGPIAASTFSAVAGAAICTGS